MYNALSVFGQVESMQQGNSYIRVHMSGCTHLFEQLIEERSLMVYGQQMTIEKNRFFHIDKSWTQREIDIEALQVEANFENIWESQEHICRTGHRVKDAVLYITTPSMEAIYGLMTQYCNNMTQLTALLSPRFTQLNRLNELLIRNPKLNVLQICENKSNTIGRQPIDYPAIKIPSMQILELRNLYLSNSPSLDTFLQLNTQLHTLALVTVELDAEEPPPLKHLVNVKCLILAFMGSVEMDKCLAHLKKSQLKFKLITLHHVKFAPEHSSCFDNLHTFGRTAIKLIAKQDCPIPVELLAATLPKMRGMEKLIVEDSDMSVADICQLVSAVSPKRTKAVSIETKVESVPWSTSYSYFETIQEKATEGSFLKGLRIHITVENVHVDDRVPFKVSVSGNKLDSLMDLHSN